MSRGEVEKQAKNLKGVSSYTTFDKAAASAVANGLGNWIAELEISDEVEKDISPSGHTNIFGLTPEQLLSNVVGVRPV